MLRALFAFFAAIALTTCTTVHTVSQASTDYIGQDEPDHFFLNLEPVRHIYCGIFTGTGEIIDQDRVLTAAHVVGNLTQCSDDATDTLGDLVYINRDLDIAVIQFPVGHLPERRIHYSCNGFLPNKNYYAIGWQNGTELVVNRLKGTTIKDSRIDMQSGTKFNHVSMVRGYIIPGMSGGPIVDEDGVMVGTNQATNHDGRSWSRPISDTYLCPLKEKAR